MTVAVAFNSKEIRVNEVYREVDASKAMGFLL